MIFSRSLFEFLLNGALDGVCGPYASLVHFGKREDSEAFWDIVFQPLREFWRAVGLGDDNAGEFGFFGREVDGIPDGSELSPDNLVDGQGWSIVDGILRELELPALQGRAGQDGLAGDAKVRVIVAGDEPDTVEAAIGQVLDELTPMFFGL